MSLINCPECGHQVSNEAVACPNCGRPLAAPTPVIRRKVVVAENPPDDGFPKWIIAPIVILALIVVFLLIAITRNNDDSANRMVNVNLEQPRRSTESRETTRSIDTVPSQVEVPSSSTTVNPPTSTTTAPSYPSTSTTVPSSSTTVPADRGTVMIDAKITTKNGSTQSVKNEKFYLLDKDVETILSDADLEPIDGNNLSNSFGLAVMYPERYSDFRRDALDAIQKHIKYSATTSSDGTASMKDVKPDSYYLFGITKSGSGFAIWSSPVSIIGGENKLNLQPARLNEMSRTSE